jgi:hypothetical protein
LPNITSDLIKEYEMGRAWVKRKMHKTFVTKAQGKRLLEIPRHRWEDNIKKNF